MRSLTGLMVLFLMLAPGCGDKDDDDGEADASCEDSLRITGQFKMADTVLNIDETLGDGLEFSIEHKIDIDMHEAGCISAIALQIKQGGLGCRIDLDFEATGNGDFNLSSFSFSADSYCPDFDDELEGEYQTAGSVPLYVRGLPSQVEMETGTEERVCLDDVDFLVETGGALHLEDSDTEHLFHLDLNLTGDLWSTGSTSADCEGAEADADADADADGDADTDAVGPIADCVDGNVDGHLELGRNALSQQGHLEGGGYDWNSCGDSAEDRIYTLIGEYSGYFTFESRWQRSEFGDDDDTGTSGDCRTCGTYLTLINDQCIEVDCVGEAPGGGLASFTHYLQQSKEYLIVIDQNYSLYIHQIYGEVESYFALDITPPDWEDKVPPEPMPSDSGTLVVPSPIPGAEWLPEPVLAVWSTVFDAGRAAFSGSH